MGRTGEFRILLGPAIITGSGSYTINNARGNDAVGVWEPSGAIEVIGTVFEVCGPSFGASK